MNERQATWNCPACGTPNVPGTDSCRVCGRHLHVDESTGASVGREVAPTGWGELAWGLVGVATPFLAAVIGVIVGNRLGSAGGVAVFAGLQIALVLWRPVRQHRSFFVGWGSGLMIGAGILVVWVLVMALGWSTG